MTIQPETALLLMDDSATAIVYLDNLANVSVAPVGNAGPAGPVGPKGGLLEAVAAETIAAGQPVAIGESGGQLYLARADVLAKAAVAGLATAAIGTGFAGEVSTDSLTLSDWSAAVGASALVPGLVYFLSTIPGQLTSAAPALPGEAVSRVGQAIDAQTMLLDLDQPVFL